MLLSTSLFPQEAAPARPLPAIPALIQSVHQNQKHVEELVKDYIVTKHEEQQELDGKGNVKKTEVKDYEVFYVGHREISRLISEEGKPLDERAQKKEQERVDKQIRLAREEQARRDSGEDEKNRRGEIRLSPSTFLRVSRLVNPRREQFHGQEVIAFGFEPNLSVKPQGRAEEIAQKLAGTVWVNEADKQIVRLEARLLDNVSVGAFIASIKKGTAFEFEQKRINDEVWMPSFMHANFDARVLFSGKHGNVKVLYTDYRKFRVESVIKGVE